MMNEKFYAAIDLGTNSCRLLITDAKGRTVYQDSIPTRLGEGMQAEMKLTDEAIARGTDCFLQYAHVLEKYNIVRLRAIATEACRSAKNAGDFIQKIYQKSGIHIEVVSPYEEARLNLKGAVSHVSGKTPYAVVVDLGGGSTEIVLASNGKNPEMLNAVSIPWGSQTASDAFQLETYNRLNAERLSQEIRRWVDGFKRSSNYEDYKGKISFVATSSTPLRLAALVKEHEFYDRERCDGLRLKLSDINKVLEKLKTATQPEMADNPCIGERRSHIFVAAVVMLRDIFEGLGAEVITASLKSAKDGIVEELIENDKAD